MKRIPILILFLVLLKISFAGDPIRALIKSAGDAAAYPGENLVTVFDSTLVDVQPTGLSYTVNHTLTKVLTAKGALDLNVVKLGYDPLSAYAEIRKVVVYKADGTSREISPKSELDYPAPARAIYWGAREKMVGVGRLEPGDAVEVITFKKGFTYALLTDDDDKYIPPMRGHYYDIVEFWVGNPAKLKVYKVSVPKDKLMQYQVYNGDLQSSVLMKDDKLVYTFSKKEILPFKQESRMVALSDVAPKLLLSTSPDWYAKSKWFYKVNEDYGSFASTPEIKKKVGEILKPAKNELDSITLLTHWCSDEVRYSGISMGCGEGYTLHKGEMTYADRCGVCKDKAGMLITMLRAAGFQSYPAMTMAGSRIDYIPADQFNHSVTVVKLRDGKYHLLDPTWVPFVRELWSSAEQQQQYLMGVPEGADLGTTPLSPPENHYIKISGNSELSANGDLSGKFTLTAEGQSDAAVRNIFRGSPKYLWKQNVEKELLKIDPRAEVVSIDFNDPIDYLKGPIVITIAYRIPEYATIAGDNMLFTPVVASSLFRNIQGQLGFDTSLKDRKYPFRDRCSRLVELNETITLPAGKTIVTMPENRKKGGDVCAFDGGYEKSGNQLVLREKVVFGKRIYDAADWPQFRDAVSAQNAFAEEPIILK
jgi:hypothetical protein